MRIALLADTHGAVDSRVLAIAASCDLIVHAGDIGDGRVLRLLRGRHRSVVAVRGNNDTTEKWPADQRAMLARVPDLVELRLSGGLLVVVHGDRVLPAAKRHARLRESYPDARAVVYGHTHRQVCDRTALPWILNPGAAGRVRTFGGPACMTVDVGRRGWRVDALRFSPRG